MVLPKSVWIIFSPKCIINFTGSTLYEEFLGIMRHSLLYFAILPCINELWRSAPNSKKNINFIWFLNNFWFDYISLSSIDDNAMMERLLFYE